MFSQPVLLQNTLNSFPFKKKDKVKVILLGCFNSLFYLDTFTETFKVPDQAVAAVNLGEKGPSSISEAVFHPDLRTIQQQIVGDVVSSGREMVRSQGNQEFQNHYIE